MSCPLVPYAGLWTRIRMDYFPSWILIRILNADPDLGRENLWIRNDLFRIRIQLGIFPDPDPGKSSGSMRIRIQPMLFK